MSGALTLFGLGGGGGAEGGGESQGMEGSELVEVLSAAEQQHAAAAQQGAQVQAAASGLASAIQTGAVGIKDISDFQALFVGGPVFTLELVIKMTNATVAELQQEVKASKDKRRVVRSAHAPLLPAAT